MIPLSMSIERLHEVLTYDPLTGVLRWRENLKNKQNCAGKIAGCAHKRGYARIRVDDKLFLVHRVVWAMHHGEWPNEIDHRNHDRADNRISNLRSVTRSQNNVNRLRKPIGVNVLAGKYFRAEIKVNGVRRYLGSFKSREDAAAAYHAARQEFYGEFI